MADYYNYFGDFTTSFDPFADNCLYYLEYSNGDCRETKNKKPNVVFDENYSPLSKCFKGNFVKNDQ